MKTEVYKGLLNTKRLDKDIDSSISRLTEAGWNCSFVKNTLSISSLKYTTDIYFYKLR